MAETECKLCCEVVSPERVVFSGDAEMVVARGVEGELGIMAGHVPIVTPLQIGELRVITSGEQQYIAVLGGYLEFGYDKVTVLADACEFCHEIDVERAKRKREEREQELAKADLDEESKAEAQISLQKALLRLQVAERLRK